MFDIQEKPPGNHQGGSCRNIIYIKGYQNTGDKAVHRNRPVEKAEARAERGIGAVGLHESRKIHHRVGQQEAHGCDFRNHIHACTHAGGAQSLQPAPEQDRDRDDYQDQSCAAGLVMHAMTFGKTRKLRKNAVFGKCLKHTGRTDEQPQRS